MENKELEKILDPISYEVIRHKIWHTLWEGRAAMELVSGSVVVTEAKEVLYGLYDTQGTLVSSSAGLLMHVIGGERMIKNIMEWYFEEPGIYDGDVFFFNDAFVGGLHNPDQACISPVFYQGKRIAWLLALFHTAETGGIEPAGMCPSALNAFHEGIRVPGLKIVERGRDRRDALRTLQRMVRDPGGLMLDIRARIAAHNVCKERLKELLDRYGLETIEAAFRQMNIDSERAARAKLKKLSDGTWRERVYLDHDGRNYKPYKICLSMTKEGDRLIFDFTGTDAQQLGPCNLTYWGLLGAVFTVCCTRLFYEEYWNRGMMNPIEVIAPEGSFISAGWPAAVGMSAIVAMPLMNLLHVAISKMLCCSEEYYGDQNASWEGNFPALLWGGVNQHGITMATLLFDYLAAGQGAGSGFDGVDTGCFPYTPEVIAGDVETYESVMPFLYLLRRQAPGSGGPGKYRGGAGLEIIYKVHNTPGVEISIIGLGKKSSLGPGLFGGHQGGVCDVYIAKGTDIEEKLEEGKAPYDLDEFLRLKGEIIEGAPMMAAAPADTNTLIYLYGDGGSGYGDPLERDPELVLKDVQNQLTSMEYARDIYGVIITPPVSGVVTERKVARSLKVDLEATKRRREEIREMRRRRGQR